jgi:quinoprotein glucose dehydrogenase
MKKILSALLLSAVATGIAGALPNIKLEPVFPKIGNIESIQDQRPVWMSECPDGSGRFFIVYQEGIILVAKKGSDGSDAKEFLNIEDRRVKMDNECGLLSLAFHPGFNTNHLFYIYYNQRNPQNQNSKPLNFPIRSVISEFKVSDTNPDKAETNTERIILEVPQPYGNHKGGQVSFGPDGYLYLGFGDGGAADDPHGHGQSVSTLLAKILRIDVNGRSKARVGRGQPDREIGYSIPKDNPFVKEQDMGERGCRKEIYALGLRNPWRFSWDAKNGDLWCGDVGQNLWEEVDLIVKGGNYGWCVREGAHHFKPGPPGAQFIEPVIEYPHQAWQQPQAMFPDHGLGVSVTGGYVYRGKQFPALDGIYIYGDYGSGTIWGLRYDRDAKKVTDHGELLKQHENICSFAEDNGHEVYALMQSGKIFKLVAE